MRRHLILVVALVVPLAGCMTEDTLRHSGVTGSAGDTIAANTAMQMVDPWPRGVQDTSLSVPAERPQPAEQAELVPTITLVTTDQ